MLFTIMATEAKEILEKLDTIKADLDYIKKHMVDVDLVLTDDDLEALEEAENDLKAGRTRRL